MAMLGAWFSGSDTGDDMARASTTGLDAVRLAALVEKLKGSIHDAESFKQIYADLVADRNLTANDIISIAQRFTSGPKSKSKKAALTAIGQERLRQSHAKAKGESAAKAKNW